MSLIDFTPACVPGYILKNALRLRDQPPGLAGHLRFSHAWLESIHPGAIIINPVNRLSTNPHAGQPVISGGASLEQARAAVILIHGRGASPYDILMLADEFDCNDCAYLAPQAAGFTWYPQSFLAPVAQNEPWLSSALEKIDALAHRLAASGFSDGRLVLAGFSQGACLALEYAARRPRRYAAVIGLSGGLIGPPGTPRDYPGDFGSAPIFLGCSDIDPHIPKARVEESAAVFERMGARVTARLYPGMGHTVNDDEIEFVRGLLRNITLQEPI